MPNVARSFSFSDPQLQRVISDLYDLVLQRKLGPESIDTAALSTTLNRERGGLWKLLQLGKAFFQRIVVGEKASASSAVYVNNDQGAYAVGIHLDLDGSANTYQGISIEMPGSATGPAIAISDPTPAGSIIAELGSGAELDSSGVWVDGCSYARKQLHCQYDDSDIDAVVDRVHPFEWSAHADGLARRHYSPTAEAFHAATGLGTSTSIGAIDLASIALRAVQRERARLRRLEVENQSLTSRVAQLEDVLQALGGVI